MLREVRWLPLIPGSKGPGSREAPAMGKESEGDWEPASGGGGLRSELAEQVDLGPVAILRNRRLETDSISESCFQRGRAIDYVQLQPISDRGLDVRLQALWSED